MKAFILMAAGIGIVYCVFLALVFALRKPDDDAWAKFIMAVGTVLCLAVLWLTVVYFITA